MSPSRPRQGLAARCYAAVVVGLRHIIPLAWIAAAVAATVALPGLGDAPAAPLDDLAAKGGSAANAQALATRTFGFPLATDTAVVQRDPRGLSQDAQRRQVDAALAVRDRRDPALKRLQAAIPLSNARVRTPSGERGTTAITYLLFAPDTSLDDESAVAQRYAQQTLGGPRAAVVGVTGAAPARQAQFHEIEQALPLIEAASVVLIAPDRGPRLPLDRRPAGGAGGRGDRLHDRDARAAVAGRARRTSRCPRRSSRWWSCSCSGWSPTTRSSSCPRRAGACARATSAFRRRARRSPQVAPIVVTAALSWRPGRPRSSSAICSSSAPSAPGSRPPRSSPSPSRSRSSRRWWRSSVPRLFGARQLREQPPPPPDSEQGENGWSHGSSRCA